jgi:tetratricopeptide (TPR) repeat protein
VHADGSTPSPEFARLITAMLSRDPASRPADGAAVLSALEGGTTSARVWPRPDRSTVLLVSALALGVTAWIAAPARKPDPASAVEVARTNAPLPTIAVLPFTTRGDRDIEYLREGMVDMLTPAFDATGLLRGIDPNSVLGAAAQMGTRSLDSAAAQSLAVRVGASRFVSGNVLVSGADMSIRATLRNSDGREVGRAQTTVRDTAGLTLAVDDVVRQLLASTLLTPGDTVAGIAAATTTSVRALRAYLDGERDLRDARPAAAMANFQRAVTIDSTFALAWYRLARAARWSEVDSVSDRAGQRAYALAATLPPRQQALIRAYHDLRVGSAITAERQLSQIVRDYPSDVEAWMLLGEVRFSSNPYVGRPLSESAEAFQQVMALDPRNREVTVYLMDLAAGADRRGQLDTLFRMYFSPNSAGEQPGIRSAYIALHRRRVVAAATGDVFSDPEAARVTLQRITGDSRDRRAARGAADLLAADPATRADGMRALALLDVAAGDWTAASARFRIVEATDAQRGLEDRALFALAPGVAVAADSVRVMRDVLRQRRWLRTSIDDGLTDVERDGLRQYLIGLLSVRLGDAAGVDAAVRALADARPGSSRVAAPLAAAVRGHWASSRGDREGAMRAFEQSIADVPTRLRVRHSVLGQHLDRLVRARALQALGDTTASRRWYRSLREGAGVTGLPFSAAADSGLGDTFRR